MFKTLDPAVVAEEKLKPKRALIVVLGTLLGTLFGVVLLLGRHVMRRKVA
ncbi:GNVR domain-containing protein [Aeromonas hydrophila]